MTSPNDGDSVQQPVAASTPALEVRKTRSPTKDESPEASTTSLPLRASSPPTLVSRSNTLTSAFSRSSSPSGRLTLSLSRFGRSSVSSPLGNPVESNDDTRTLIVRAFSPTIAVYASQDTNDLVKRKGLQDGFLELIRPFGEHVPGKIVVRDSTGASRAWEDFGVRFTDLGSLEKRGDTTSSERLLADLEDLLDQYIENTIDESDPDYGPEVMSPYYGHLLKRLLSSEQLSQHEAFLHPAAAIIAISSATPSPIETLRNMYQQTAQGSYALPPWANPEYLRYYVLVHDEDRDDFSKSSALFDQMKRHFGLHCHLLRLRSDVCTEHDENAEQLPACEWLTAAEEIGAMEKTTRLVETDYPSSTFIFSSDATAVKTLIREHVAQSVVPHMEQRISLWNDQIASRRKGISGRLMTFSKRWTGLGSSSRSSSSSPNMSGSGASGNYDSVQDQYRFDAPEALLRRMADFAMMLRDYKLAASTYELLRSDFSNDKAWKYLAGANEMCCIATLLNPLASGSTKLKIDAFDQMIETASYSYLTRCRMPSLALRATLLSIELLKVRGPTASEMATKWAIRTLQMIMLGSICNVLVSERVVSTLATRIGLGSTGWGTRKRKAAMWSVIAADEWMKLGRAEFAAARLDDASQIHGELRNGNAVKEYHEMAEFIQQLQLAVKIKLSQKRRRGLSGASKFFGSEQDNEDEIEETTEQLEQLDLRPHRMSLIGTSNNLETAAPLSPVRLRADPLSRDDDFE